MNAERYFAWFYVSEIEIMEIFLLPKYLIIWAVGGGKMTLRINFYRFRISYFQGVSGGRKKCWKGRKDGKVVLN